MRLLLRLLLLVIVAVPCLLVWLVLASLQDAPLVASAAPPTPADVSRARALLRAHDPRRGTPGRARRVAVSERELDLALNYAISIAGSGAAKVGMRRDALEVELSIMLPPNPIGRYLNVRAILLATGNDPSNGTGFPRLAELMVGGVAVPPVVANYLFVRILSVVYGEEGAQLDPREFVDAVSITAGRLTITYKWPEDVIARLTTTLVSPADAVRLEAYQLALVEVVGGLPGTRVSMLELVRPLFVRARQRSLAGDAVAENRALLMVLATYASGRGLGSIVDEARGWPRPRRLSVTLQGRRDFTQHFLTSAGLAAVGGGALSDAVGLFKEVEDSTRGSGFSFTDLAADRAGTRFGEVAVATTTSAVRLQEGVASARSEAELMPEARDLPEHMSDTEFKRRFGSVDSPELHSNHA